MTGSVECYGKNTKLREQVNLDMVADCIDVKKSKDREQIQEIEKMHALTKKYKLDGQFHWITAHTSTQCLWTHCREGYDLRSPNVCGCHGGPAEIIEHGLPGFHIDPYYPDQAVALMAYFYEKFFGSMLPNLRGSDSKISRDVLHSQIRDSKKHGLIAVALALQMQSWIV
ncbi:hypothetical protein NC652_033342 [Populus alba x Populus x berolinensis]|nr:hypothetical protein NC652_033342 [Populus alba x Populus x berolinensis]